MSDPFPDDHLNEMVAQQLRKCTAQLDSDNDRIERQRKELDALRTELYPEGTPRPAIDEEYATLFPFVLAGGKLIPKVSVQAASDGEHAGQLFGLVSAQHEQFKKCNSFAVAVSEWSGDGAQASSKAASKAESLEKRLGEVEEENKALRLEMAMLKVKLGFSIDVRDALSVEHRRPPEPIDEEIVRAAAHMANVELTKRDEAAAQQS